MKQLDVYVSPAVTQKFEMNGNGNLILSPPLIQYIVVLWVRDRPIFGTDLQIWTMFGLQLTHLPTPKSEHLNPYEHIVPDHPPTQILTM